MLTNYNGEDHPTSHMNLAWDPLACNPMRMEWMQNIPPNRLVVLLELS